MLCTMPMVPRSLFLTFPLPSYAFLFPSYCPTALSPEVVHSLVSMPSTIPMALSSPYLTSPLPASPFPLCSSLPFSPPSQPPCPPRWLQRSVLRAARCPFCCTMPMALSSPYLTSPLPASFSPFSPSPIPPSSPTVLSPGAAPMLGSTPSTMPMALSSLYLISNLRPFPLPPHSPFTSPAPPCPQGPTAQTPGEALTLGSTPSMMPMDPSSPPFNLRSTNLLFPPLHLPPSPLSIFPPLPPLHLPHYPLSPSSPLTPLSIFPPPPPLPPLPISPPA
ncbi:unnamed protein product [Closterium sp. NIES-53]